MLSMTALLYGTSAAAITAHTGDTPPVGEEHFFVVTIASGTVDDDLDDFPIYVELGNMPEPFWDHVLPNGGNIRALDENYDPIPMDLISFEYQNQRGALFVRKNVVAASDTIFRVQLNPTVTQRLPYNDANGREAVWQDYDTVTIFGPDALDRSGKQVVRSNGDQDFLKVTTNVHTFSEDPHQGGTFDGTHHYIIDNNTIYKFNAAWTLVDTNSDPIGDTGLPTVNHLGDPCVKDGILYIPLEYYLSLSHSDEHIALFNADDLTFITVHDISSVGQEISSICYCTKDELFYIADYVNNKVHKYTESFSYVEEFILGGVIARPQGIEWFDEAFWIVSDDLDEVMRVEHGTGATLLQQGTSTTAQGYFGQAVTGNMEGIWKVGDKLYVLHDPSAANSYINSYESYYAPLSVGGGYERISAIASVQIDNVPEYTVWTIGVTGRIKNKSSNSALATYRDHVGGTTPNDRATVAYRVAETSYGVWDDVNAWMMPSIDFDPSTSDYCRFHMQYDGSTGRYLYANGELIASQAGITSRTGFTSVNFGRDDADELEIYTGEIGFGYLRSGLLSADWIAAEYLMISDNEEFLSIVYQSDLDAVDLEVTRISEYALVDIGREKIAVTRINELILVSEP